MENIQGLIREEKGKLEVEWDQSSLSFIVHLKDSHGHSLLDAQGESMDDVIYQMNELCGEYMSEYSE